MLKNYFDPIVPTKSTIEQEQRLLAVQAALEVLKSHDAGQSNSGPYSLLQALSSEISKAADAIQEALKK